MAFRFPLASVLRVRAIQEEREERTLTCILAEIARTAQLQDDTEAALAHASSRRGSEPAKLSTGAAVHSHYGELASLLQTQAELQAHREKLEALREKQVAIYAAARRNREMLSGLNDAQRAAYNLDLAKREQKTLDDIFGSRLHR